MSIDADPRVFLAAERSLLALLSTLSFRAVVAQLAPHEKPATRFASVALVANLGVAVAGLALAVYLALSAR